MVIDLVLVCTGTFNLYATVTSLISQLASIVFAQLASLVRRGREML